MIGCMHTKACDLEKWSTYVRRWYVCLCTHLSCLVLTLLLIRSYIEWCHSNRILEELGTGEFGVVSRAKWAPSSSKEVEVAIKTLNTDASDKNRLRFLQEAAIMCQFDHKNVIKLHGVVTEAPRMIVLEYMPRGDLENLLIKLRFVALYIQTRNFML